MKKTRMEKGITLVALIITIIVLLILSVVAIRAVQGDGIIRHTYNAVNTYNEKSKQEEQRLEEYFVDIEEVANNYTIHSGIIPEGGKYCRLDGTEYVAGDEFPEIKPGDTYKYGDYTYEQMGAITLDETKEYLKKVMELETGMSFEEFLASEQIQENQFWEIVSEDLNATNTGYYFWEVCQVENKEKTQYGEILGKINGGLVTVMDDTFSGCRSLVTAPAIPSSITDMENAFMACTSLVTAPVIPSSITNMDRAFMACPSLEGDIEINANPTNYSYCFEGTEKTITITGSASDTTKAALAATSGKGNVKY